MPRLSKQAGEVAYPKLTRRQIDTIITELYETAGPAGPFRGDAEQQQLFAYLVSFHTKRWGLPTLLKGRG